MAKITKHNAVKLALGCSPSERMEIAEIILRSLKPSERSEVAKAAREPTTSTREQKLLTRSPRGTKIVGNHPKLSS